MTTRADIRGKWALVTGASRGIGRQVSLALADQGCNVVLHSRDLSNTAALAAEVASKGVEVRQVEAELASTDDVSAMLKELLLNGPPIDILYNNAAIMTSYYSDWLSVPADDLRLSFEVNVTALIHICHTLIPGMVSRGWGRVINVTSGIADQPELIAYAVSKAAVDKFVYDTVGKLEGTGVLMNLLDPGWLRTDLGGPNAPNSVESVIPGALVPALINDGTAGKLFRAQDYAGTEL
ncbi:DltE Short-chain dehydrogenases of various substrate specificities [Fimbriimonadaceae bacterium]